MTIQQYSDCIIRVILFGFARNYSLTCGADIDANWRLQWSKKNHRTWRIFLIECEID